MLTHISKTESLTELAKLKSEKMLSKTIPSINSEEAKLHGWTAEKKTGRATGRSPKKISPKGDMIQVTKPKPHGIEIADRIWSMLYTMGFSYISGDEPIQLQPAHIHQPVEIDIVCTDADVGLAIFLKTSPEPREADTCFAEELSICNRVRSSFSQELKEYKPSDKSSLKPAFIIFTYNISLSESEIQLAKENHVIIFNENDLQYYEDLVDRLGLAAKYQFLAEVFEDSEIPGLQIEVPAIKLNSGKFNYYVFAIRPEHLLKIAFIAHHKPGRQADLTTYQRMANKERLDELKEYISESGIFPNNIVVSLHPKPTFERSKDLHKSLGLSTDYGELGKLKLPHYYKSAWIIDGQHRLFSYSDHERASTSSIVVVAFEELTAYTQTKFFFDINSKQARIDESHLAQLQGKIYQDASTPAEKILALIPQAIPLLDQQEDSPFYQRIYFPDQSQKHDKKRCIPSGALNELLLDELFTKLEYGVFYVKNDEAATIERAVFILKYWFTILRQDIPTWWDAGDNRGKGGLTTEKGVTIFLQVLKQVILILVRTKHSLNSVSTQDLGQLLQPSANKIGRYLATFSDVDRQAFRDSCKTKKGQKQQIDRMLEILIKEEFFPS